MQCCPGPLRRRARPLTAALPRRAHLPTSAAGRPAAGRQHGRGDESLARSAAAADAWSALRGGADQLVCALQGTCEMLYCFIQARLDARGAGTWAPSCCAGAERAPLRRPCCTPSWCTGAWASTTMQVPWHAAPRWLPALPVCPWNGRDMLPAPHACSPLQRLLCGLILDT